MGSAQLSLGCACDLAVVQFTKIYCMHYHVITQHGVCHSMPGIPEGTTSHVDTKPRYVHFAHSLESERFHSGIVSDSGALASSSDASSQFVSDGLTLKHQEPTRLVIRGL